MRCEHIRASFSQFQASLVDELKTVGRLPFQNANTSIDKALFAYFKGEVVMSKFFVAIFGLFLSFAVNACNIDFSIELQTFGENVAVELRTGAPGSSRTVTSQRSQGGSVNFGKLCAGSYFLAIGNGDSVSVTPVRQFESDHSYSGKITLQRGSGNVSKQSRKSL